MKAIVLYIHGKGGSAAESEHYRPLFPGCEVLGLDYRSSTPREAGRELREAVEEFKKEYESITLVANSIGAFFSLCAGIDALSDRAYFLSPVVDLEALICDMMVLSGVTEERLRAEGVIVTASGEELSWDVLCYVRTHPLRWTAPTEILYGSPACTDFSCKLRRIERIMSSGPFLSLQCMMSTNSSPPYLDMKTGKPAAPAACLSESEITTSALSPSA